jgi:hypothetical protein
MKKWFFSAVLVVLSFQGHAEYAVGDSALIKSRYYGNYCAPIIYDSEDLREVVARTVDPGGVVDLQIHEIGHLNKRYFDSVRAIPEDLFIDWRKLRDPLELQHFCDTHKETKGVIEWVDVPAGHFLACKFTDVFSDAPGTKYFGWYGAVPMAHIKSEMTNFKCTEIEELQSFSP